MAGRGGRSATGRASPITRRETFDAALDTAERIATEVFLPHRRKSDVEEPKFDGERVHLIPEVESRVRRPSRRQACSPPRTTTTTAACSCRSWWTRPASPTSSRPTSAVPATRCSRRPTRTCCWRTARRRRSTPSCGRCSPAASPARCACRSRRPARRCADVATRAEPDGDSPFGPRYRLFGNKMWISAASTRSARTSCTWCWRRSRAGRRA